MKCSESEVKQQINKLKSVENEKKWDEISISKLKESVLKNKEGEKILWQKVAKETGFSFLSCYQKWKKL